MKFTPLILVTVLSCVLAACGGGSGSTSTAPTLTANSFDAMSGTYASGCLSVIAGMSTDDTLIVASVAGSYKATVSIQSRRYLSDGCVASTVQGDVTVQGEISALQQVKTITGVGGGKSGVAKAVQFSYTGLKLVMGNLNGSIPLPGATTKVGYLLEGNKLYALTKSLDADGLPGSFSTTILTKQ